MTHEIIGFSLVSQTPSNSRDLSNCTQLFVIKFRHISGNCSLQNSWKGPNEHCADSAGGLRQPCFLSETALCLPPLWMVTTIISFQLTELTPSATTTRIPKAEPVVLMYQEKPNRRARCLPFKTLASEC